jgi:hypothetical protein
MPLFFDELKICYFLLTTMQTPNCAGCSSSITNNQLRVFVALDPARENGLERIRAQQKLGLN